MLQTMEWTVQRQQQRATPRWPRLVWTLSLMLSLGLYLPRLQAETPTLTIATSLTHSSLMVDIEQRLKNAYRRVGYELRIEHLPAGRSLTMSNDGIFDGELFRIADVERDFPNLLRVPVPLARIELHAFTLQGKPLEVDWTQQRRLRIGYVRGFRLAERFAIHGQAVPVTTASQAVQMLLQDRIDVLLEDEATVRAVLGPSVSQLRQHPTVLASAELFHFIHKKHQALLAPLSAALR